MTLIDREHRTASASYRTLTASWRPRHGASRDVADSRTFAVLVCGAIALAIALAAVPNWPAGVFQDDGIYVDPRQGARQRGRVSIPEPAGRTVRDALSAGLSAVSRAALEALAAISAERRGVHVRECGIPGGRGVRRRSVSVATRLAPVAVRRRRRRDCRHGVHAGAHLRRVRALRTNVHGARCCSC